MTDNDTKREVGSDQTLFSIIEHLQQMGSAGVTELADEVDLSKGAVHKHLATLKSHGYVRKESGKYQLDFGFLTHGGYVRDNCTLCRVVESELADLERDIDELLSFAVKQQEYSIYTHIRNDDYELRNFVPLGTRVYLNQTAAGKAILATLPSDEVEELLGDKLPTKTVNTIGNIEDLHQELTTIGKQGFAISNEESLEGVMSIAASVEDTSRTGAISISVPSKGREPADLKDRFRETIVDTANRIELHVKYRN